MKLYVIAKFEERHHARQWMQILERAGHTITYNWCEAQQYTQEQAVLDFEGVKAADAVVFVSERNLRYCGALVEMGMALALGKPVYMTGHALDTTCIFTLLPGVRYDADELMRETPERLAWAKEAAERRTQAVQGYTGTDAEALKAAPEQADDFATFIKHGAP